LPRNDGTPRGLWSGTIAFGLVSVPVELFPATKATPVATRMLAPDGTPLARRYRCPEHDRPLEPDEIIRGYDTGDGEYVVVEEDELRALAPEKSREIDLQRFVAADEIAPRYLDRSYVLVPAGDTSKAYRLLAAAMEKAELAGIATFVMRGKEWLVAIMAEGGVLRAQTLRFADEVRSAEDVGLPDKPRVPAAAVKQFERLIAKHLVDELDPGDLDSDHAAPVRELAERKYADGEVIDVPEEAEDGAAATGDDVVDLMQVLKQKLAGAKPANATAKESGTRLAGESREALYARAKKLGIEGRSKMTKAELARAIAKAS
jgi:DNA end-binding protein Ku